MSHLRTTIAAVAAAAALTGCSMGSDSSTTVDSAKSAATSAASSAAASDTPSPTSASAASGESSSSSPASQASSSTQAPSSSDLAPSASAPVGTQTVKASVNKLSFAVPKAWTVVDDETSKQASVRKQLETISKKAGVSPEKYIAQMTTTADVFAVDATAAKPFNDNINILKITRTSVPDKAGISKELTQLNSPGKIQVTPGDYTRITTPAGAGAQETYTLVAKDTTVHGVSMVIPNGAGSYSMVTVSASSAGKAEQYAKDVAASAQKM